MTQLINRIKTMLCVLAGCAFMASPVFFSDRVLGSETNTQSVFPLDKITRNYNCEVGYYALTFDDGPYPETTPDLVSMLSQNKVPATFFNVGKNAAAHPELVTLEHTVGVVAGHSYGHDDYTKLHPTVVAEDIKRTMAVLPGIKFYRPPYGASNVDVRREIKKAGLIETMWTVDAKDYEEPYTTERLVEIASTVKAGGIVLLHDGWPSTRKAVPTIINNLHAKGLCPGKLVETDTPQFMVGTLPGNNYPFNVKAAKP
jgi:peptidoglycan/xylan/chitin deacetylase (PgdA/CDA1 family)